MRVEETLHPRCAPAHLQALQAEAHGAIGACSSGACGDRHAQAGGSEQKNLLQAGAGGRGERAAWGS